ncbi:retron Ec78 anti-phage system effector HNH endonuclease PtuB [Vibrio parahaemolyticus]|uniref:retron Ec78 anti-phage system effector HNH endonuclease PtuB n=1 Tax=Vibrio parahaemolyticus TaxID=670 RepID=UPI001EED1FED|nr:retron Ec78 anti-phage system effector HNH endonuclease PtuB [Vibrio parahaemolyticus]MCG0020809.1 TIGR02646 family protein [Vibrio parahaemolyticus]
MKKLNRLPSDCLAGLVSGRDDWMDAPKEEVWVELDKMQNGYCAYCECHLKRKHIEHFKTRTAYPKETFSWANIFGSCGDSSKTGGWGRCGIYKDAGAGKYDVANLVKPDEDDPNDYFLYLTSGIVIARPELTGAERHKATETIRVFNLNGDSALFNSRRSAILTIQQEIDELYQMQDELGDDWSIFLEEALTNVNGEEFQTALEHAWSYNLAHS